MSTPTFAKTYNLIAFLEKPSESDGFEQIVDFINANQIKYALTNRRKERKETEVSPTEIHKEDHVPTTSNDPLPSDAPIIDAPSSSQHRRKHKNRRKERKETEVSPTEIHTEDHVPTTSNDPLPSGEDRIQLKELMDLCTNLSNKVLDRENKGRKIDDIDADAEVNLENVYNLDMAHEETVLNIQDVTDADVKEVSEEMVEVIEIAKIIVDEVSTAGGELNAANEKPVNAAPTNITTAQPRMSYEEIRPLFKENYNKVQTLFKEGLKMDEERIKAPRKRTRKEKIEKDQTAKKQNGNELKQDNAEKQKLEEQKEAE
nr:hypothetical protein [Tanacetum cinerariifolium]